MDLYTGVVENRLDPHKLGRCQVRIVGLHTDDKTLLPTEELPWAYPMQPVTSAAISGIGSSPVGPVPGTWVVVMFRDKDLQQPIMLGTIGGIPQTKSGARAAADSGDSLIGSDTTGDPEIGSVLVSGDGTPVTSGDGTPIRTGTNQASNSAPKASTPAPVPAASALTVDNTAIPTTPPPKSGASNKATAGIKALIAACDKVGLTTKYAKCALLGIAGGESKWVPQKEGMTYNPVRLKEIFSTATPEQVQQYSYAEKKGMTRAEFFSFFYGPTFRGKNFLGNKTDADGGKYFGRGFIQLTGRGNYERYQKLGTAAGLNIDIVNNPDSLDDDLEISALIAALYIKDRVKNYKTLMYDPGFFPAAKAAVGVNSPDIAAAKLKYYEYFYGGTNTPDSTNKSATATEPNVTAAEIAAAPPDKKEAYKEDRTSQSDKLGFTDPSGKYPLRDHMNEADTNRLARGVIEGTCFKFKDATRKNEVPTANNGKWSQPLSSYNTMYPYNKVMETESGHIFEFDDSPSGERIHLYHRKGTFNEIDPNGSEVHFVVGDRYSVTMRNDCIYVVGSANLTVGGKMNVLIQGDANIEVEGRSSILLKGDTELGIAGDLDMTVGQDFNLKVDGDFNVQAANIRQGSLGTHQTYAVGNIESKSDAGYVNLAATTNINSTGEMNILSGGAMHVDYSEGQFGNGAAAAAPVAIEKIDLAAPELLNAVVPVFDNLQPPGRSFEEIAKFETPDEWETPAGQKEKEKQYNNPTYQAPENKAPAEAQEAVVPTGNNIKGKEIDKAPILARSDFPSSYSISKNFKIGQLVKPDYQWGDYTLPPSVGQRGPARVYTKQDMVANLAALAENILEPIYTLLGPTSGVYAPQSSKGAWAITSGLRNDSGGSDHAKGRAFDMQYYPKRSFKEMWQLAVDLEKMLPYNQIILEYRKPGSKANAGTAWQNWIHISYSTDGNAKMAFSMIDDSVVNSSGVIQAGTRGIFLFGTA
jgi:predicted chitinase